MSGAAGVLERVTPVVLTFDEAPNIGRTLEALRWAKRVVVVDSFSTDGTLEIVRGFPNAVVVQRRFDGFASQCNWALREAPIETEWVLMLDADYLLSDGLVSELRALRPEEGVAGYAARFRYCVGGRPLRGSLYPPVTVLYRRALATYVQEGHAHRVRVEGATRRLEEYIRHDDRKPLGRWVGSQLTYMRQEADALGSRRWAELGWPDRIRALRFAAPFAAFFFALVVNGTILDGRAGLLYAFQRLFAETLLSLMLLERDLERLTGGRPRGGRP